MHGRDVACADKLTLESTRRHRRRVVDRTWRIRGGFPIGADVLLRPQVLRRAHLPQLTVAACLRNATSIVDGKIG